jgi:glycosyltransferase involved in cell wall biosynthesis
VVKFIPLPVEQDYPDFEIVLIDDASSDNTLENLKNLKNNMLTSVW